MFNKIMSGLGLQGVTVETRLQNPNLQAGETLHGEISFKGGSSDKEINGLYLQLMTMAEVESGDHEFNQPLVLQEWLVNSRFLLPAHQAHSFPFSINCLLKHQLQKLHVVEMVREFGFRLIWMLIGA